MAADKGVGRKFSKLQRKKYRKLALFSLFQGGREGNGKKGRKIALLSLYLLYLCLVWKSGRGEGTALPAADAQASRYLYYKRFQNWFFLRI